jgi:predicted N-acyltransferase
LLILARQGRDYVAGAFGMLGNDTLYGRHWGCSEQFPFLHFELCYYQTIEYAIKHRLQSVDAGVQGEHKLARGFEPVAAESWHWLRHPGFRHAVQDFLVQETAEVKRHIHHLREQLPYR